MVWPLPRSLATTDGISVDFFSSPYLDVSVQAVPHRNLWIQLRLTEYCSAGFPHSEICGLSLICSSPQLIAACRVLLRLSVPRHSPCALHSLTCSSQSPRHSIPLLLASNLLSCHRCCGAIHLGISFGWIFASRFTV